MLDLRQIILVLIFAMCSADFTSGYEATILSVLRELLLTANLLFFFVCLLFSVCLLITLVKNMIAGI